MNRRNFLKSLGALTAVAALPLDSILKATQAIAPVAAPAEQYIEITFFGTGLQLTTPPYKSRVVKNLIIDGMLVSKAVDLDEDRMITNLPLGIHTVRWNIEERKNVNNPNIHDLRVLDGKNNMKHISCGSVV